MNKKRIVALVMIAALTLAGLVVCSNLYIKWHEYYLEPPRSIMSWFDTVKLTLINPATVLDEIHNEKPLVLQIQPDPFSFDQPFIMPIRWSQHDFLEVAQAYGKVIWQDDLSLWHLYKVWFDSDCDSSDGRFNNAEFLYYREVTEGEDKLYAVRAIELDPEEGMLIWGEDAGYHRPSFFGWINVDENFARVPADQALALADARGGSEFRKTANYVCSVDLSLWPEGNDSMDWSVSYYGSKTRTEFWIPSK
jgi:hypothetical protein